MPWEPCVSGAIYTWGAQKGKRKGHNTQKERDACKFCNPTGTQPDPPIVSPEPAATAQPAQKPAGTTPSGHGTPQPATYAPGTAEVASPGAAKKKAEEQKDYVVDGGHTLMFWNEVVFYWLGFASDALDRFVWKVDFHVDKSKLAVSPFAATQLNQGNVGNMYTRLATRFCKLFKLPDQKAAHLAIEDAAFLSKFGGVLAAFGAHWFRVSKESPRLKAWRVKKAEQKAKAQARKDAEEAASHEQPKEATA